MFAGEPHRYLPMWNMFGPALGEIEARNRRADNLACRRQIERMSHGLDFVDKVKWKIESQRRCCRWGFGTLIHGDGGEVPT